MINPKTVAQGSEMYLTIGPFLIHHTWEKGSLGDDFLHVVQHYASFLTPPDRVDRDREIHEIPLYPSHAPAGALNALNVMTLDNELRRWAASEARNHGGFMCHSAGVINKGKSWLLPGRSGAGKSTLALKLAPKCEVVLSDEVCIVLPIAGTWKLWGTPFYGTGEQGVTGPGSSLQAIIFPHRDRSIHIESLDASSALTLMLRAIVNPRLQDDVRILDDIITMLDSCRLYKAGFGFRSTTEEVYDAIIAALSS
jgi:hypothetical protein